MSAANSESKRHKVLAEERVRVNTVFVRTVIDQQAVESLPENGVPQQLIECGFRCEK